MLGILPPHDPVLLPVPALLVVFAENRFSGQISSRTVHHGGNGGGRRCEDLDLFRVGLQLVVAELTELRHILVPAAWMCGYEVICQIKVLTASGSAVVEPFLEFQKSVRARFSHKAQNASADMFRCDLHLAGDMVLD